MVSTKTVTIVAVLDVLLATTLIILYVGLMSENFPELQLVEGSKKEHIIVYIYVSFFTVVQLLFAFKFYRALTEPSENEDEHYDVEEHGEDITSATNLLKTSKYWLIASYILLINWIIKAGIYSQQCGECSISFSLALYAAEIAFRICAIVIVNPFITQQEKKVEMMERRRKIEQISHSGKKLDHNPVERY